MISFNSFFNELEKIAWEDRLPGGLADNKKPSDFPPEALKKGVKVESEHTSDKKLAKEITMDHLTEDKEYYDKLQKMEKKAEGVTHGMGEKDKAFFERAGKSAIIGGALGAAANLAATASAMHRYGAEGQMALLALPVHTIGGAMLGVGVNELIRKAKGIDKESADLTEASRDKIKKKSFAIPETRRYPIHDAAHARNALARVSQHGTPEEKERVRAAVARKWPGVVGSETKKDLAAGGISKDETPAGTVLTKKLEKTSSVQGAIRKHASMIKYTKNLKRG